MGYTVQVDSKTCLLDCKRQKQSLKKSYFMVILLTLLSTSSGFQCQEYVSISNILSEYYQLDFLIISLLATIFYVIFLLGFLPSTWFLKKYGLRKTLLVGSLFDMAGAWIKCLNTDRNSFWFIFTGQSFAATGAVFIVFVFPHFASVWFPPEKIAKAIGLAFIGQVLGPAIGLLVPTYFVDDIHIQRDLKIMNFTSATVSSLLFIFLFNFFEEKPQKYGHDLIDPSTILTSKIIDDSSKNESHCASVYRLLTSIDFLLSLFSYGIVFGTSSAFQHYLNEMITEEFGDDAQFSGTLGAVFMLSQVIGILFTGYLLDKSFQLKRVAAISYALTALVYILFTFTLSASFIMPLYVLSFLFGFTVAGASLAGIQLGVKIASNEHEGTSSGLLTAINQLSCLIYTTACSYMIDAFGNISCNLLIIISLLTGTLLLILIKKPLIVIKKKGTFDFNVPSCG